MPSLPVSVRPSRIVLVFLSAVVVMTVVLLWQAPVLLGSLNIMMGNVFKLENTTSLRVKIYPKVISKHFFQEDFTKYKSVKVVVTPEAQVNVLSIQGASGEIIEPVSFGRATQEDTLVISIAPDTESGYTDEQLSFYASSALYLGLGQSLALNETDSRQQKLTYNTNWVDLLNQYLVENPGQYPIIIGK